MAPSAPTFGGLLTALDPFSGKPEEDIKAYFASINRAATIGSWTDEQKLSIAKLLLKGEAAHFLEANPEINDGTDFNEFMKKIVERYDPVDALSHALSTLMSTTQKPNETTDEFATRLRLVGKKTYRKGANDAEDKVRTAVLEENLLAQFMRGLKRNIRRQVLSRAPKTFKDAITIARDEEQNLTIIEGQVRSIEVRSQPPATTQPATSHFRPRFSQQTPRSSAPRHVRFSTGRPRPTSGGPTEGGSRAPRQGACYGCGSQGHQIRDCRAKNNRRDRTDRSQLSKNPNGPDRFQRNHGSSRKSPNFQRAL